MENLPVEIKGVIRSVIIAILLSIFLATVVFYTGLKETAFYSLGKLVIIVSVFSGGCYVSKAYGSRGLIHGISLGVFFFTLMFVSTLLIKASHISLNGFIYTLLLCICAGGIGGVLGIALSDS